MRKIQEVLGLPILNISSGKSVGVVKDLLFNQHGEVKGVVVDQGGLFSKPHFVAFEDIGAIGDDALTIGAEEYLQSIAPYKGYYGFSSGKQAYKELPIITTNGHELGRIEDVYFLEELGKIVGYEISDGFISDITEGRRTIQRPSKVIIGEDALIIPSHEVKDVEFGEEF